MTNLNEIITVTSIDEKNSIVNISEVVAPLQSKEVVALSFIKGGTSYDSYIAGEPISGGRVIVVIDGLAYHANIKNIEHRDKVVGFSRTAAAEGVAFDVAIRGKFYYYGLGLIPDVNYTFDELGRPSTSPPTGAKFWQTLGNSINQDTINIKLSHTISRT